MVWRARRRPGRRALLEALCALGSQRPHVLAQNAAPRRPITQEEVASPAAHAEQAAAAAPQQSGIRLVVVDGDPRDIGKELVLPLEGELFIGRSPDCALTLHDRKMSRNHCRIERDGDRYRVSDLSSMNGTVVNGLRAASARFGVGDYIRLGFTVIAVQRVREATPS